MTNFLNYLWIILLAIYIISPFDAHPLFLDDLIASVVLFYYLYKNSRQKKQQQQYDNYYRQSRTENQSWQNSTAGAQGPLTLEDAYRKLGVNPDSSMDEISRAYKEKMIKSHPDKVSHLSKELQEKAKELTMELNAAIDLIKRYKKR
jgi:hypothetical protein